LIQFAFAAPAPDRAALRARIEALAAGRSLAPEVRSTLKRTVVLHDYPTVARTEKRRRAR
jgi:hypothetical protein